MLATDHSKPYPIHRCQFLEVCTFETGVTYNLHNHERAHAQCVSCQTVLPVRSAVGLNSAHTVLDDHSRDCRPDTTYVKACDPTTPFESYKCEICSQDFVDSEYRRKHYDNHGECEGCGEVLPNLSKQTELQMREHAIICLCIYNETPTFIQYGSRKPFHSFKCTVEGCSRDLNKRIALSEHTKLHKPCPNQCGHIMLLREVTKLHSVPEENLAHLAMCPNRGSGAADTADTADTAGDAVDSKGIDDINALSRTPKRITIESSDDETKRVPKRVTKRVMLQSNDGSAFAAPTASAFAAPTLAAQAETITIDSSDEDETEDEGGDRAKPKRKSKAVMSKAVTSKPVKSTGFKVSETLVMLNKSRRSPEKSSFCSSVYPLYNLMTDAKAELHRYKIWHKERCPRGSWPKKGESMAYVLLLQQTKQSTLSFGRQ